MKVVITFFMIMFSLMQLLFLQYSMVNYIYPGRF